MGSYSRSRSQGESAGRRSSLFKEPAQRSSTPIIPPATEMVRRIVYCFVSLIAISDCKTLSLIFFRVILNVVSAKFEGYGQGKWFSEPEVQESVHVSGEKVPTIRLWVCTKLQISN